MTSCADHSAQYSTALVVHFVLVILQQVPPYFGIALVDLLLVLPGCQIYQLLYVDTAVAAHRRIWHDL